MSLKSYVFVGVLSIASQAQAIQGTAVVRGGPESVCRIIFRTQNDELYSLCSGNLISATQVSTAGHCVGDAQDKKIEVQCGYTGFDPAQEKIEKTIVSGTPIYIGGPTFLEHHTVKSFAPHEGYVPGEGESPGKGVDTAVIELGEESKISAMPMMAHQELRKEYFDEKGKLIAGAECQIAGFGRNNGSGGILHSAPLTQKELELGASWDWAGNDVLLMARTPISISFKRVLMLGSGDDIYNRMVELKRVKASVAPGDSGSGLLCKKEGAEWKIAAVASSMAADEASQTEEILVYNLFWNPNAVEKAKPVLP